MRQVCSKLYEVEQRDNIFLRSTSQIQNCSLVLLSLENSTEELTGSRENDSVGSDGHLVIADIIAEQGDVGEGLVGKHVLDLVGPFFMEVIPGYHCTS